MAAFKRQSLYFYLAGALGLVASEAFAAGVPSPVNWYEGVLHALHIDHKWESTLASLVCTVVILLIGLGYKAAVARAGNDAVPSGKFSMAFLVESVMDLVYSITRDNGGHHYRKYLPVLAGAFIFILINNLSGLVPGLPPATETMDNNVALGLIIFLWYNAAGVKENGFGAYVKHFLGPVAFIAPLFFCLELISHASRPLSLGLRLTGNIFGDHTLLNVFTSISYLVFPALLTFFGLLVAVVQSFVFTLLSGIYLSMAISHDH